MIPLMAAAAVFKVGGALSSASAAKRESRLQAKMEEEKTAEEVRRTQREDQQMVSMTRAIMGASGTTGTGSQAVYLRDMQAEQSRQLTWLRKVGSYNANSIRRQGNALASQYKSQAMSSAFEAGASMFGGM